MFGVVGADALSGISRSVVEPPISVKEARGGDAARGIPRSNKFDSPLTHPKEVTALAISRGDVIIVLFNVVFVLNSNQLLSQQVMRRCSSFLRPHSAVQFGRVDAVDHLSTLELMRALVVFKVSSFRWLVASSVPMLRAMERVVGFHLTYNTVVKWTFFSQFCAGTDVDTIQPTIRRLSQLGVGPILDYAAEADVVADAPEAESNATTFEPNMKRLILRTDVRYDSSTNAFDGCASRIVRCIEDASKSKSRGGLAFAALKMTGLCDPQLLARISAVQMYVRQTWVRIIRRRSGAPPIETCRVLTDRAPVTGEDQTSVSCEDFADGLRRVFPRIDIATAEKVAEVVSGHYWKDPANIGRVDYLEFTRCIAREMLSPERTHAPLDVVVREMQRLTHVEMELLGALRTRLRQIGQAASHSGVRVMVDAEQTFYQMGIDQLTRVMQREFNKERPVIYNTYQGYLRIAPDRIKHDLIRARRQNWVFGAKLVRGAYMEQETDAARKYDYENPICETKAKTDDNYNLCASMLLDDLEQHPDSPIGVLFGTHNEESLVQITERVRRMDPKITDDVAFAQLLGMADHLTFPLAAAGFNAYKYVPYGDVRETIFYLQRRALENQSVLANQSSEVRIIKAALRRRFPF